MLLNWGPYGFEFFWGRLPEKGAQFFLAGCDLHSNYGMVVILLSFLFNYNNLTLKLHQKKKADTMMKDEFLLADLKLRV